jgi:glycosyltransferase involved in cell wall biosynthesis
MHVVHERTCDASSTDATVKRLRVLAMIGDSVSGPARQLVASVSALAPLGIDMRIAVLRRGEAHAGSLAQLLERIGIPFDLVPDAGPLDMRLVSRVRDLIDEQRPQVLQTHSYKATSVAWLLRRTGMAIPWVGFFHGFTTESRRARIYHRLDHLMLASADCVIAMSALQRATLARRSRDVRIVHNAVTRNAFPSPAGAPMPDLTGLVRPRIGVIGRLSSEKGVDIFLHALARVIADGAEASSIIAGDGPERSTLETLATSLGLGPHVRFIGHVGDPWQLYSALDLVVIPSRTEGLPNVLLEALAADVSVLATRVGAVPDVLAQPGSGIIVEPGSVEHLAAGLTRALATLDSEDAQAARAATLRPFSLEQRAQTLERIYRDVLPVPEAHPARKRRAH